MPREVTVRVPFEESLDLLERPARACVGFIREGRPHVEPVHLRYEDRRYLIRFERDALVPDPSDEVVLIVDEGVLFFELRAVYVRGVTNRVPSPSGQGASWVEVIPTRTSSWNYGRMRWRRDTE